MRKTDRESKLQAENKRLRAELAAAEKKIANLEQLVGEMKSALQKALSQAVTAPSCPSGQIPPYAKPSTSPNKRKKRPGRKAGHPGACRKSPEKIDRTEPHTLDKCPHCSDPVTLMINEEGDPCVRSRVVEDIVLEAMEAIDHIIYQYWCRGCNRRVEPVVTTALPKATIGLNLMVTTAVQHYLYGISISKIQKMLEQQHGIRVSAGGLLNLWHRLAEWLYFQYQIIQAIVQDAGVLHADETGWRVSGQKWWLWCFVTKTDVLFLLDESRGGDVPVEILGNAFGGILITDFYAAYNACNAKGAQYCLAHLLREFKKIRAKRPDDLTPEYVRFERRLKRLIREAIKWSARSGAGPPEREKARDRFETRALDIIDQESSDPDVVRLSNRILRHAHGIFTFVTEPGVEPTNNWAETNIRPAVVMRKNSYGNQSERGAHTQAILMSVFRSMELKGKQVIPHTLEILEGAILSQHAAKLDSGASDAVDAASA